MTIRQEWLPLKSLWTCMESVAIPMEGFIVFALLGRTWDPPQREPGDGTGEADHGSTVRIKIKRLLKVYATEGWIWQRSGDLAVQNEELMNRRDMPFPSCLWFPGLGQEPSCQPQHHPEGRRLLASREGRFVDTEGTATPGAAINLMEGSWITPEESVVFCNTGSDRQYPESMLSRPPPLRTEEHLSTGPRSANGKEP